MRVDVAELRRRYPRTRFDRDRHGNPRWYAIDPQGRKVRLRAEPGSDAWAAEYAAAVKGAHMEIEGEPTGSLGWLIRQYYQSPEWKGLSDITRQSQRRIFENIRKASGDMMLAEITAANIRAGRDARADTPSATNNRLKRLVTLFNWGMEAGLCHANPARDVKKLKPRNTGGFHTWTVDECLAFEARHPLGTKARAAYAMTLYLGLRRQDIPKLGPQHRTRDGFMRIQRRKKRGEHAPPQEVWIAPQLAEALDALEVTGLTYLQTEYGRPFSVPGLGNKFRDWCDQAGLPQCSAHGLRKAVAARMREAGCSIGDIQAVTDHDTSAEVDRYTRDAMKKQSSRRALEATFTEQKAGKIVPLRNPQRAHPGAKKGKTKGKTRS